jgi:hypothetical protein
MPLSYILSLIKKPVTVASCSAYVFEDVQIKEEQNQ